MPKLNEDLYGADPQGAANAVEIPLGDAPTLDVHGEDDSRAKSEGNHGAQPSR
jgi:hypothetical protein